LAGDVRIGRDNGAVLREMFERLYSCVLFADFKIAEVTKLSLSQLEWVVDTNWRIFKCYKIIIL